MKKNILIILIIVPLSHIWGQQLPDCVREQCEAILKDELGKKTFDKCVEFDSYECVVEPKADSSDLCGLMSRHQYMVNYALTFPKAKNTTLKLGFMCTGYQGTMHVQSEYFLRNEHSDLPSNFKKKGLKIVDHETAKTIACEADSLLMARKGFLKGALVPTQTGLYWIFESYLTYGNPHGDAEMSEKHSIWIDPYTSKVFHQSVKAE